MRSCNDVSPASHRISLSRCEACEEPVLIGERTFPIEKEDYVFAKGLVPIAMRRKDLYDLVCKI